MNIPIVYAYFLAVDLFFRPCTKQWYCNIGFFHLSDIHECDTDNGGS